MWGTRAVTATCYHKVALTATKLSISSCIVHLILFNDENVQIKAKQNSVRQQEPSNRNSADSRWTRHASHVWRFAFWRSSGSSGSVVSKNFEDYVSPLSDSVPGVGGERQGGERQSVCTCLAFIEGEADDLNVPSFDSTHSQPHGGRSQMERGSRWHQSRRRYKRARTRTHAYFHHVLQCTTLIFKTLEIFTYNKVSLFSINTHTPLTHTPHTQPTTSAAHWRHPGFWLP